jgi:type IV pilus assembly protein PilM
MLGEIQRSLEFYRATTSDVPITKVVLSGGSAHVPGLDRLFEERLEVPFEVADPLARIDIGSGVDEQRVRELGPALGVAIGLGLRRHDES